MRIALVHSFYSSAQPSGENKSVDEQLALLTQAGHTVRLVAQRTDELRDRSLYSVRSGITVATGHGPSPIRALTDFRPDVVHVHNLFPNWGTTWLNAWNGPIVATLHNYRSVCAAGTLYRNGGKCTDCLTAGSWSAVRHACYGASSFRSIPLALKTRKGVVGDSLIGRADRVIALGKTMFEFAEAQGVPRKKLALIPNFSREPSLPLTTAPTIPGSWLFVGRLSSEKGILEMLSSWPDGEHLAILGDGPLRHQVQAMLPPGSRLIGPTSRQAVLAHMRRAKALVFPGRCIESATPLVVVEALSCGLPVIALAGSEAAIQVKASGGGVVVDDVGSWAKALETTLQNRNRLAVEARRSYEDRFSPDHWLPAMTTLYTSAIEASQA